MNIDLGIPVSDPADPCYIASFPRTKKSVVQLQGGNLPTTRERGSPSSI